ncbi:hypothetical protein ACOMHN_057596 [Nucella lapillus]
MTTMTTRARLHLRPSSGAPPAEACHRFATTMTTMTTRDRLHLRPSSGAPPAEDCHLFAATVATMTTRANLHLHPSSGAPPAEACHQFATMRMTRASLQLTTELVYRGFEKLGKLLFAGSRKLPNEW